MLAVLVNTNLWVAVCAAALTYASTCLVGRPIYFSEFQLALPALFVFCSTLFAYNFQRLHRLGKPNKETVSEAQAWIVQHRKLLMAIALLAGAGSLVFFALLPMVCWVLLIPFSLFSLGYTVRYFYRKGDKEGLRDIPYLKIYLIALTWTGVTLMFPLVYIQGIDILSEPEIWIWLLERFLFVLAITIPFDVRDLKYDAPWRKTIPQLLGTKGAVLLAQFCLLASSGLLYLLMEWDAVVSWSTFCLSSAAYLLIVVLISYSNTERKHYFYSIGVEAASLLLAVALLVH